MITNNDTTYFDKCYSIQYNNNNEDSSTIMEKYSCWSILFIDGLEIEAKIIHKGKGKFKIVADNYKLKYVNKIVDASDVVPRCNINCINKNIILFYFFFCLVSNLVNGTTVAEGLNVAGLVLLSGSKGCFHKCF